MPRYEFAEGSSNKFWEITLDGTGFTTTYGKIGATGQTSLKSFGSTDEAKKQYDKLIAEKTKKGYQLVGGEADSGEGDDAEEEAPAAAAPAPKKKPAAASAPAKATNQSKTDPRNPELEQAIFDNPSNREAFAVLGDWLQEQGDPRGELISLQLGNKEKQAKDLIAKKADVFLGPLAPHQKVHDEGANNSASHLRTRAQEEAWQKTQQDAFLWRNGYIYRCRLSHDTYSDAEFKGKTVDILNDVLSHPSGRFIVEFAFMSNGDPNEDNLQDLIDALAKKAPLSTRKLSFGDNVDQISWHHTGNLAKLWKNVPKLRILEIETGEFEVGTMVAPALERGIFITGGLSQSCGKGIATATMPSIKHLEIYYGTEEYGGGCSLKEVQPLLDRSDLTHLEYLGIKNSEFADDVARALNGAKVLKTLKTLDLSLGTMSDEGAAALVAAKKSLEHLEVLDLTRNYLSKKAIASLKGLCKKVITAEQEDAEDDDRYVSITE